MEMKWNNIKETQPEDGQRVLTWDINAHEVYIQTYNEYFQCWDDEYGDDYEYDLDKAPYWMPLPEDPEK